MELLSIIAAILLVDFVQIATSLRSDVLRYPNQKHMETMGDAARELAPSCTTHFNVVDQEGMIVLVTQTLLSIFGSRLILPSSGIPINNGIMWLDPETGKLLRTMHDRSI